jgi:hypothetical protein
MGLAKEHDGPVRPAGPGRQVEGYETVPLPIAGAAADANGNGMAVLRRCTARPSKRAVVYVHCLDDSFVPPDLVGWYTDRGFDFYAADLRTLPGGPGTPEAGRAAGALGECFACLDAAVAHLRAADAIQTVVVSGHTAGALVAALWCHARRGSRPVDALVLANPELRAGRPWRARARAARAARANGAASRPPPLLSGAQRRLGRGLEIACPVLVMCPAMPGHGPGGTGGLLPLGVLGTLGTLAGRRTTTRLGEHVTWLTVESGLPGQAPAAAPQRRHVLDELGRWLSAYLSGQIRDQLLLWAPATAPTR